MTRVAPGHLLAYYPGDDGADASAEVAAVALPSAAGNQSLALHGDAYDALVSCAVRCAPAVARCPLVGPLTDAALP